ncbi:hypothetical protein SAMN04488693_101351 [Arthrobacter subterraneus]|uniref:Core-binding (CB) domain-containing protein n=2 Tax=Arthrobacter subterraneus TaxID=335973 RepID=A0A1G8CRQ6_9MICC|nr:hypothetical protein SAMN04488693_101351 [Arthrobacter subterraneus]
MSVARGRLWCMNQIPVEQVLGRYFSASAAGRHPATVERYGRVLAHLRFFLEQEGDSTVSADVGALLALERQFEPEGAFERLLGAEQLVYALPRFLSPPWLLPDFHDRLAQISLVSRLVQWLCSRELVDSRWHRHAVMQTRAAAEKARRRATT